MLDFNFSGFSVFLTLSQFRSRFTNDYYFTTDWFKCRQCFTSVWLKEFILIGTVMFSFVLLCYGMLQIFSEIFWILNFQGEWKILIQLNFLNTLTAGGFSETGSFVHSSNHVFWSPWISETRKLRRWFFFRSSKCNVDSEISVKTPAKCI